MKIKIKRLNGETHQFDDVIKIEMEAIEVFEAPAKEKTPQNPNTPDKKQVYICNELGSWGVDVIRETPKAFLVNTGDKELWLPKSKFIANRIQEKDFNYFLNKN